MREDEASRDQAPPSAAAPLAERLDAWSWLAGTEESPADSPISLVPPLQRALLDVVALTADGVFAVDSAQRIVYWSRSMERILETPADRVLGRRCYEVMRGIDPEGQPLCSPRCAIFHASSAATPVENFDVVSHLKGRDLSLNVSVISVDIPGENQPKLVHLVRDFSKRRRRERLARAGLAEDPSPSNPNGNAALTARELQVLRLIADGYDTEALVLRLGIQRVTVHNHIQRILSKLDAHSRREAVAKAIQRGII